MYQQRTLFDGFIRIEILDYLSNDVCKLLCQDVIDLCNMFYELNIASLAQNEDQEKALYSLAVECSDNNEYFIAYELSKVLSTYNPNNVNYVEELALVSSKWNLWNEAQPLYQKLIKLKPYDAVLRDVYGKQLFRNNQFQLALEQMTKATEIQPEMAENEGYITACIVCYVKLRDFQNAKKYFMKAMEIEPTNYQHYYQYAKFLRTHVKDYEESEKYYLKALEIDPEQLRVNASYGHLLYLKGEYEKAMKHFKLELNLNVKIKPMNCDSYYQYAKVLRDYVKNYAESERYYLKALEIDNGYFGVNASYGYLLYLMGEYEKALEYIRMELRLDVKDKGLWAHFYHGLVNRTIGNDDKEETELLKAVELVKHKYDILESLKVIKESDPLNEDYYKRFEALLSK